MPQPQPPRRRSGEPLKKAAALLRVLRRRLARFHARRPRFFTPAFQVMYILTAVSAALTWLSWKLMWYLPQAAKMELIASTGVDPDSVTVLVSQDAYAIFAGMCILTLFCVFVWLFVWLKKL